jgi:hypothetical protein
LKKAAKKTPFSNCLLPLRSMKQMAIILLAALLFYNAFGYYLLFAYERNEARVALLQEMPDSAFQIIKVKAALYTSVANTPFEFINEDLTVGNKTYRIVKRQIQNDTLSLYYLRHFREEALRQCLNDIVESQTFGNPVTPDTPVKQMLQSFLKDYIPNNTYIFVVRRLSPLPKRLKIRIAPADALQNIDLSDFSPPPEVA